jgi:hypothetical protein
LCLFIQDNISHSPSSLHSPIESVFGDILG